MQISQDPNLDNLATFLREEWDEHYLEDFPEGLERFAEKNEVVFYTAQENKNIQASAIITPRYSLNTFESNELNTLSKNLFEKKYTNISYVLVKKECRSRGVGSKLLQEVQSKFPKLWLKCTSELELFYEKNGFNTKRKEKNEYIMKYG